jgi:oligopeptide/dipeptide ABC transporter ATP-binding protein
LLEVRALRTEFRSARGLVTAVDGVSFHIDAGEVVGMVGESGCGKSAAALSLMRLIPDPPGRIASGSVRFNARELLTLSEREMRSVRGGEMSMVFQDPMTSLNPMLRIRRQMTEAVRAHLGLSKADAVAHSISMLRQVGIPAPEKRIRDYPHQLSGGMRQRVVIAIALACHPKLVLADEPTTALDVTIQAQILELMRGAMRERNTAVLLITHDLGVVAGICDRIIVMYAGAIIEQAPRRDLFYQPRHPYTMGLLKSVPRLDRERAVRLPQIEGVPPDLARLPSGCSFQARCPFVTEICRIERPVLRNVASVHIVACHRDISQTGAA